MEKQQSKNKSKIDYLRSIFRNGDLRFGEYAEIAKHHGMMVTNHWDAKNQCPVLQPLS